MATSLVEGLSSSQSSSTVSLSQDLHRILRLEQPVTTGTQTLPIQVKSTGIQYPVGVVTVDQQTDENDNSPMTNNKNNLSLQTRSEEELSFYHLNDIQSTKPIIRELGTRMLKELQHDNYRQKLSTTVGLSTSLFTTALNTMERSLDELNRDNDNSNDPVLLRTFTQSFAQPDEQTGSTGGANTENNNTFSSSSSTSSGKVTVELNVTSSLPYRYLPCTGLSWNVSGSLLAASFGHREHNGWCHHRAGIAIWNAFRSPSSSSSVTYGSSSRTRNSTEEGKENSSNRSSTASSSNAWKPEYVLDTDSCITSVAFHQEEAGIIAAGTVNGDIYVWNIFKNNNNNSLSSSTTSSSMDEPLLCRSRMNDYIHREPIMNLSWNFDHVSRTYTLLSLSREGKLCLWSIDNKLLHPLSSAQLSLSATKLRQQQQLFKSNEEGKRRYDDSDEDQNESDDDTFGSKQRNSKGKRSTTSTVSQGSNTIGGTCCTFSFQGKQGTQNGFFVGGEGGGVYTCTLSVSAAAIATGSQKEGSQWRPVHRAGAINKAENTLPWEQAAVEILLRVPELERARVCRIVERYAREANSPIITLGLLYSCRFEENQPNTHGGTNISTPKGILFPNPIKFSLLPHTGSVLSLASSNYHRNLLASGGIDGKIHIYSALLSEPLLIFEPTYSSIIASQSKETNTTANTLRTTITSVYSLAWSPIRPLVLAGGCSNGTVVLYDLYQQTTNSPVIVLPYQDIRHVHTALPGVTLKDKGNSSLPSIPYLSSYVPDSSLPEGSILSIQFNPSQRRILAVSDSYGRIMIWKLPWIYGRPENQEEVALHRFMSFALAEQSNNPTTVTDTTTSTKENPKVDPSENSSVVPGLPRLPTDNSSVVWKDLEIQAEHTNSLASLWTKWKNK